MLAKGLDYEVCFHGAAMLIRFINFMVIGFGAWILFGWFDGMVVDVYICRCLR